jgi:protein-S-isoprenylcysteine O-methyltransferase Ste14
VRASAFEFRFRFFFLVAVFASAFLCYRIEPRSAAQTVGAWLKPYLGGHGPSGVLWIGTSLTLVAAWIRTWASAYLGADVVGDAVVRSENLVANGPYRFVRNPLYLALILLAAGIGVTAPPIGWGIAVAGTSLFLYRLLLREEAELSGKHNESYQQYLNRVPRLLPALLPRVPRGAQRPRWGQAFFGEIMMWCLAASMATLSITLDPALFRSLVLGSFVLYGVARLAGRLARRSTPA